MIVQLVKDLNQTSDLYEYQQREVRRIIQETQLENQDISIKRFKELVSLVLTDNQQRALRLEFNCDVETFECRALGKYGEKPYYFLAKEFNNGEVGWTVVFFDEDEDECKCVFPFEYLYQELLKVLMRYRNMLRKSEQSSPDDEADSDADSTTEKEE